MDVAIYAKEIWHNLELTQFYGNGRQVIDQFKWYIEESKAEKGFLELDEETLLLMQGSQVDALLQKSPINKICEESFFSFYRRRFHDLGSKAMIDLDRSYYVGQNIDIGTEININIDSNGHIEVMYEDDVCVEIGSLPLDSNFFGSRFHADLVDVNDNITLVINDIFCYKNKFLADMPCADRIDLIRKIDFEGSYQYCDIMVKKYVLASGTTLLQVIDSGREFLSTSHLVGQYNGAYLFRNYVEHVFFFFSRKSVRHRMDGCC